MKSILWIGTYDKYGMFSSDNWKQYLQEAAMMPSWWQEPMARKDVSEIQIPLRE